MSVSAIWSAVLRTALDKPAWSGRSHHALPVALDEPNPESKAPQSRALQIVRLGTASSGFESAPCPNPANRKSKIENRKSSSAFTLIELLLAVGIAATLLALLFSLYFALSRSADEQRGRRDGGAALGLAVEQLTRDLMSAMPVPGYDVGGFRLETEDAARGPASSLTFCTARRAPAYVEGGDSRWFEIVEVTYRLEYAPRERGRLLRTERPLVGPEALEPARTNVLVVGVDRFEVRIRAEDEWVPAWNVDAADDEAEWPRAARITVVPDERMKGGRSHTADVLIPTGWVIEPREELRQGAVP